MTDRKHLLVNKLRGQHVTPSVTERTEESGSGMAWPAVTPLVAVIVRKVGVKTGGAWIQGHSDRSRSRLKINDKGNGEGARLKASFRRGVNERINVYGTCLIRHFKSSDRLSDGMRFVSGKLSYFLIVCILSSLQVSYLTTSACPIYTLQLHTHTLTTLLADFQRTGMVRGRDPQFPIRWIITK